VVLGRGVSGPIFSGTGGLVLGGTVTIFNYPPPCCLSLNGGKLMRGQQLQTSHIVNTCLVFFASGDYPHHGPQGKGAQRPPLPCSLFFLQGFPTFSVRFQLRTGPPLPPFPSQPAGRRLNCPTHPQTPPGRTSLDFPPFRDSNRPRPLRPTGPLGPFFWPPPGCLGGGTVRPVSRKVSVS